MKVYLHDDDDDGDDDERKNYDDKCGQCISNISRIGVARGRELNGAN